MTHPGPHPPPPELPRPARIAVLIPALNEEQAIGRVLEAIPRWVGDVIVVDNGSTDRTIEVARAHRARVVAEPRRGYGAACLAGLPFVGDAEVVVFLDADFSDHPEEMHSLVTPILDGRADLVIGSRITGRCAPGALTLAQRFGNALACRLMQLSWGVRFTDLGPFRAVRRSSLEQMKMDDRGYGWTVQMQARAASLGLRVAEVPVSYRRRIGRSKISGTIRGVIQAGSKILFTIWNESRRRPAAAKREQLVVFARDPQPGRTKTRLIPALGAEGAATLQHRMTLRLLREARCLRSSRVESDVVVQFAAGTADDMRAQYGADLSYRPQCGGDLGERLSRSFADAFSRGARSVVAVGTDCPGLKSHVLYEAFDALANHELVIGPATDGGYYLIGMRGMHAALFQGIDWSTPRVLEQTRQAASNCGLSTALLRPLDDIDRPEDLANFHRRGGSSGRSAPFVSVVIPTLDEQKNIGGAIRSALVSDDDDVEVIVVDGGSRDNTVQAAEQCGATVLRAPRGRARQMNAGAAAARGEVLVFLHADSRLPSKYRGDIRRALASPGTVAGAFTLQIGSPASGPTRLYAAAANFRSRIAQMPYGDQAVFLTKAAFARVGGYPGIPIMEDVELLRRLRRFGTIRTISRAVVTSDRRWRMHGPVRMSALNQLLVLAYLLGADPHRLHIWRESGELSNGFTRSCVRRERCRLANGDAQATVRPDVAAQ